MSKKPAITKISKERQNRETDKEILPDLKIVKPYAESAKVGSAVKKGTNSVIKSAFSLICFLFAVLLATALCTYVPSDPGFSVTGSAGAKNLCGILGAWVSDFLYWALGFSAWWLVLWLLRLSWHSLKIVLGKAEKVPLVFSFFASVIGLLFLLTSSVAIETLQLPYLGSDLPLGSGGLYGQTVATYIAPYIGVWGASIVFVIFLAVGISIVFRFSWIGVFEIIGQAVDVFFKKLSQIFQGGNKTAEAESKEKTVQSERDSGKPEVTWDDEQREINRQNNFVETPESNVLIQHPEKTKPSAQLINAVQGSLVPEVNERVVASLELLDPPPQDREGISEETIRVTSRLIESKLKKFRVDATVVGAQAGPVITQYWLELADGVKGSHVEEIRKDLTRALAVHSVRVVPVIPGKPYMGLEIPNGAQQRMAVYIREIVGSENFEKSKSLLSLALGKDISGRPMVLDLARMPHILVGGTTGSGKSVAVNTMILSLLYKSDPSQLRLVLIDPKCVEFTPYQDIPHLLCPVVTDMSKAANALAWLVHEMDHRYNLMSHLNVRSFDTYNEKIRQAQKDGQPIMDPFDVTPESPEPHTPLKPLPYIVCFIDELADLILVNRKQVEMHIMRLAQKARAAGMHLVLATQRPSVDIVTPLIKTNIVARMCFQVASRFDSQVVLDENGAQDLLGRGDMLLRKPGENSLIRIQGCMVSENEVNRVTDDLKSRGQPDYKDDVTEESASVAGPGVAGGAGARRGGEGDPLYDEAVNLILTEKRATTSFVQRRFNIGYNRAANLLESMEAAGIISKPNAAGKREILVKEVGF